MITNIVKPSLYQDSVALMQIASGLKAIPGIAEASLMMGTAPNKEMLAEASMLAPEGERAGPNDLIIALRGDDDAIPKAAQEVETLLRGQQAATGERRVAMPRTLSAGLAALSEANLALISTPGLYAAAEARKALQMGLNIMIFSDNVSIEDERDLKQMGTERGLLVMGPDCGTAIIGGVPLGFANAVRRGPIGVVGASGTGMQEITVLVDRLDSGISHAIGTGSHDLSAEVGGLATMQALRTLQRDPQTEVIVLVSKPPSREVAANVLRIAGEAGKPVVVVFPGAAMDVPELSVEDGYPNISLANTLEEAAYLAVRLLGDSEPLTAAVSNAIDLPFLPDQKYVRGLFSGGTFCSEAAMLLSDRLGEVYSNTPLSPPLALADPHKSIGHTCVDMGADEFTVGRPHPMIDLSARIERIAAESRDPEVAVLLLDVVLGYGAHSDPAGALAPAIREARRTTAQAGRQIAVVAHLCGTDADPQGFAAQRSRLEEAGALLAPSNAAAARLAASLALRATGGGVESKPNSP